MAHPHSEYSTGILLSVIILSFVVASSLNVYPLSTNVASLRPLLMIMVLIFWVLFQPRYVGVFTAFTIGLIADLMIDTRMGQQAFAAVMATVAIKMMGLHTKPLNAITSWFVATLGLLVFQLSLWLLQLITQNIFSAQSGLPLLISIVSWPLVLLVLHRFTLSDTR